MGADMQAELGLLRRLQEIPGIAGDKMSLCYDLAVCDLLVVSDSGALPSAARHLVGQRPQLPLWLIGNDGELHDAFHAPEVHLGETAIRDVLRGLGAAAPSVPDPANEEESHAGEFVAAVRAQLEAGNGHALIALAGNPVLYVDFGKGVALPAALARLPADRYPAWLGNHFAQLSLHPIEAARFADAVPDAPRLPLVPLLWQTVLRMQADPVLIAPLEEQTCLHLKQWPDFRVLGHRHDDFRLCSLLLKRASTARECSHMLGIDPGAVRAFFNAAYFSGCASPLLPEPVPPPRAAPAVAAGGSILAGMWRRMRYRGLA